MSSIDRRGLVERHSPVLDGVDPRSALSVGNGEFAFTADVTGLQTFPQLYPVHAPDAAEPGTLLGTQAQWAWHSVPAPVPAPSLESSLRRYASPHGPVDYVDLDGSMDPGGSGDGTAEQAWLRSNPHRLDLGRIGLVRGAPWQPPGPDQLGEAHQRLDLWTGLLESSFRLAGDPVRVQTCAHPGQDVLAVRVLSPALRTGRLALRVAFPYGSTSWSNAADWHRPDAHVSTLEPAAAGFRIRRALDDTRIDVGLRLGSGMHLSRLGAHEFGVHAEGETLELVVAFAPGGRPQQAPPPTFASVRAASEAHWARFWEGGGTVDVTGSADPRAPELQRRIVLSQYLTAVHGAGSLPPAETGLVTNSWRGRFHLEMHWWHAAHFALWGRPELLARSMDWYPGVLDRARETARRQGFAGARWPKQVAPDGRESPSAIGAFLLWQQPHPIHLAELLRRACGDEAVARYGECVLESAAFMADVVVAAEDGFHLGPPLVPAQESYHRERAATADPTFELAYWAWALRVAQRWRAYLGLDPEPRWSEVAEHMAPACVRDGRYAAIATPPYTVRDDHPSMLYALGVVPDTGYVDASTMRATLKDVLADWHWESTWGWDFPAIAMTAARLGEPHLAVDALLLDTPKNTHLPSGHNRQTGRLPVYLPGNGGLLAAVALMAAGWDGGPPGQTPGFPDDGSWTVRWEGIARSP
ncbi:hypothetical protein ACQPWY_36220 [Pseudonocardia xinjiangensis]|uniref:hypothetical protein n=1 Tax=Pseudonocardia xinjiangensis TaxID=75289 RepID=UPI003D93FB4C